jgi:hypothetical protein
MIMSPTTPSVGARTKTTFVFIESDGFAANFSARQHMRAGDRAQSRVRNARADSSPDHR